MAASDWMRFQLAYGFGTVRAAKALEKWHSPTLLFHTEDWRLRQHGMGEEGAAPGAGGQRRRPGKDFGLL